MTTCQHPKATHVESSCKHTGVTRERTMQTGVNKSTWRVHFARGTGSVLTSGVEMTSRYRLRGRHFRILLTLLYFALLAVSDSDKLQSDIYDMPLNGAAVNGDAPSSTRFLELIRAAGHPKSSDLSSESLAQSIGIAALPTPSEAIELVEKDVLSPPKDLSGPDLWRWQVPLPTTIPLPELQLQPLPATHTVTPSFRGIDGNFTQWRDGLAPKPPAHPSLSSSMHREPGALSSFVRGKSTNAPFLPGGLEPAVTYEEAEEELEEEDGWKTRAPGMRKGLPLDGGGLWDCVVS